MSLDEIIKQQRKEKVKKTQQAKLKQKKGKGISPLNRPALKPSSVFNGQRAYSARNLKTNAFRNNQFVNNQRKQGNVNTQKNRNQYTANNQRRKLNTNAVKKRAQFNSGNQKRQGNVNFVRRRIQNAQANNQGRQSNVNFVKRRVQNSQANNQSRQSNVTLVRNIKQNRSKQFNRNRGLNIQNNAAPKRRNLKNVQQPVKELPRKAMLKVSITTNNRNGANNRRNAFIKRQPSSSQRNNSTMAATGKRKQRVQQNVTQRRVVF